MKDADYIVFIVCVFCMGFLFGSHPPREEPLVVAAKPKPPIASWIDCEERGRICRARERMAKVAMKEGK